MRKAEFLPPLPLKRPLGGKGPLDGSPEAVGRQAGSAGHIDKNNKI